MNSKPLTYDCLRAVLQHMEANQRIEIAARVPSIRAIEKTIPLKIGILRFDENFFVINNRQYEFRVYRHYGNQTIPEDVASENRDGGCKFDIDEYGFKNMNSWYKAEPGDIVMKTREINQTPREVDETIRRKEMFLVDSKSNIHTIFFENCLIENHCRDLDEFVEKVGNLEEKEEREKLERLIEPMKKAKSYINEFTKSNERILNELQPYYNCRDNIPLQYIPYLQLTIQDFRDGVNGNKQIKRFEYDTTLPGALRTLLKIIFGKRIHPVHVNLLFVDENHIIRLPKNLKLKIQRLAVRGCIRMVCNPLQAIIDNSSYPLEEIHFYNESDSNPNFETFMVKSAKKLIIRRDGGDDDWLSFHLALQNKFVENLEVYDGFPVNDFVELIRHWITQKREIGTIFTFILHQQQQVEDVLRHVVENLEGVLRNELSVAVPITTYSQLQVSYEPKEEQQDMYTLAMEVVPIEDQTAGTNVALSTMSIS